MKAKIKFQISIEKSRNNWEPSPVCNTYDEVQQWRRKREAELLRDNPSRMYINSNLIIMREIVEDKA